ncbi:serine/threonine protein kinase [Nocardioides dongxiaopingii]|uniref:serine/threonine-protein kinase n=1 Tax=Nocardioides TaxID=1839 RepID=UPI0010C767B9|nr:MULTISPECIES: serine/threonine-protein kinase [Nocardioides]QCW52010.1 serine/threonine protein kinase [Nocardioides sp. S-1144]
MVLSPGSPQLGPGASFGPYRIDRVIGVGGMGVVYLATDGRLGRRVALKTVLGHLTDSPAFVERFQREAAALARLESPHVIQIFDHGVEDDVPFIATQYAAGGDLGHLLRTHGPMPPQLAAELCSQVADAMADAHRVGVIHRDVKPANVLLRDDRLDRVHVYLCDFGVALTDTDTGGFTEPGGVSGTWNYLAPERISGGPGSAATDLYAVGCLLWETLTGRPPYGGSDVEVAMGHQGEPVPQLPGDDEFSRHANRVLARALAKDPTERYPSASALRDDLRSLAGLTPSGSAQKPVLAPAGDGAGWQPTPQTAVSAGRAGASTPRRSRRAVWGAVAAVAVLACGTGAVLAVTTGDDGGSAPTTSGTSSGSDPSPTSPSPTPAPDTPEPITGDLTGDGLGDVGLIEAAEPLRVYASDGRRFLDPERKKRAENVVLSGDVDRDGVLDLVRIGGDPPNLAAVVAGLSVRSPVPVPVEGSFVTSVLDVSFNLADLDGNGYPDLVMSTQVGETERQVDVALGDGTGAFAAPTTWFSGPLPDRQLVPLDADDDGTDDLVSVDRTAGTLTLLRSDGSAALAVEGEPTATGIDSFGIEAVMAGDVDGDGTDELVAVADPGGLEIGVLRWDGTAFESDSWFRERAWPRFGTATFVLSDVDGDGDDDLVRVGDDRESPRFEETINVFLSDGTSAYTRGTAWRVGTIPFTFPRLLGPQANNNYV